VGGICFFAKRRGGTDGEEFQPKAKPKSRQAEKGSLERESPGEFWGAAVEI